MAKPLSLADSLKVAKWLENQKKGLSSNEVVELVAVDLGLELTKAQIYRIVESVGYKLGRRPVKGGSGKRGKSIEVVARAVLEICGRLGEDSSFDNELRAIVNRKALPKS